jgi:hypothetical protein
MADAEFFVAVSHLCFCTRDLDPKELVVGLDARESSRGRHDVSKEGGAGRARLSWTVAAQQNSAGEEAFAQPGP